MGKRKNDGTIPVSIFLSLLILGATISVYVYANRVTTEQSWTNMYESLEEVDIRISELMEARYGAVDNIARSLPNMGSIAGPQVKEFVQYCRLGQDSDAIRLYLSTGSVFTERGEFALSKLNISYKDIVALEKYITPVHEDPLTPGFMIMEQIVPVRENGKVVAMLSMLMDPEDLKKSIRISAYGGKADCSIMDRRDGIVFADTEHSETYPMSDAATREALAGYSMEDWYSKVMAGKNARVAYQSQATGDIRYIYSIPSVVDNWTISMRANRTEIFALTDRIRKMCLYLLAVELIGFVVCLIIYRFYTQRRIKEIGLSQKLLSDEMAGAFIKNYMAIFRVDLKEKKMEIFAMEENASDAFKELFVEGADFEEAFSKCIDIKVYEPDREMLREACSYENMKRTLSMTKDYLTVFRLTENGQPRYCEIYITKIHEENGEPTRVAIGLADRDEEIIKHYVDEKLYKSYNAVYMIDLDHDVMRVVSRSHNFDYSKVKVHARGLGIYSENMRTLARSLMPEYREFAEKMADATFAQEYLAKDDVREFLYRRVDGGWVRVTCHVVERDAEIAKTFIMTFTPIDKAQSEKLESEEVISALTSEYSSLYAVQLDTGKMTVMRTTEANKEALGDSLTEDLTFPEMMEKYLTWNCHPDDVEKMLLESRLNRIRVSLSSKDEYTIHFRKTGENGQPLYFEMHIATMERDNAGRAYKVVIGFTPEDEASRLVSDQQSILTALASEYSNAYYVNLSDETVTPYNQNILIVVQNAEQQAAKPKYAESIAVYINNYVFGSDVEMMRRECELDNIKEKLRHKKSFSTIYRSNHNNVPRFCEMVCVKAEEADEEPAGFVMAFAEKDAEIMNRYIIDKLSNEYSFIYLLDLEHDLYRIYKMPNITAEDRLSNISWSESIGAVSRECVGESKSLLARLSNVENVRADLRTVDSREYVFQHNLGENNWLRANIQVLERNSEGDAISCLVAIASLDNLAAKRQDLNLQLMQKNKELEEQQHALGEALQMANAASNAKTVFLANMSHDIRTPMNAIIGFTNLVQKDETLSEESKGYIAKVIRASNHLSSLLDDVLDMSRIETGELDVTEDTIDLCSFIDGIGLSIKNEAERKGQKLVIDVQEVKGALIISDQTHLRQILWNTLSNSIKFTPEDGTISLTVHKKPYTEPGYNCYEFRIKDTGIGMSKDFLEIMFDPFARAQNTTTSGVEGIGLGMAITKNLVNMMSGEIHVSSEENVGTEVVITIPFKEVRTESSKEDLAFANPTMSAYFEKTAEAQNAEEEVFDEERFKGAHILLVEDFELNMEIAEKILTDYGMEVDCAVNGQEAVEKVKASEPGTYDMILMDIQMPVMDGLEATRIIRDLEDPTLANIPIVAMTANAFAEDCAAALEAGMDDHVAKPISIPKLMTTMQRHMAKK